MTGTSCTGTMLQFYNMQTLQTLCFVKLVEELESFSPGAIAAQLPPTQRSMLLLRLPVVDVMKLERTSVVRGIDMNAIWEKLYEQRVVNRCGILVAFPFDKSSFSFDGGCWKENYMAIVTSLLLNLYKADFAEYSRCRKCIFDLLLDYIAFITFPQPKSPPIEYSVLIPGRLCKLEDTLDTPCKLASFLMQECNYKPKLVHVSCSMFRHSPFWMDRSSSVVSYHRTLKEFLSDARKVVFSTDKTLLKTLDESEGSKLVEYTHHRMVCQYVLEMILCSDDPKLESLCTDDKCPVWVAESIVKTICKSLCDAGSYTASISREKSIPYKKLKNMSFSMAMTDSHQQLDSYLAAGLTSALDIQTSLESVQIHTWPCDAHFTDIIGEEYFGEEEFTDLFSALASLFKQPQFWNLELAVTSVLPTTLRELLHTFFTTLSPNRQSLKLDSVAIIQRDNKMPDAIIVPDSNETFINKSLCLSSMELTPSLETLIFSCPLLSLESLALVNLTSVSPSKCLDKAANLLCSTNKNSHLKKLILKDIVFRDPYPQDIISAFLQSPNLQHVEIEHVDVCPDGLTASLLNEISKLKELCILKLLRLDLGKQSERFFHQLCVAVLSLPRVSDLSLDLSSNELSLHQVTAILDTWKQMSSGKKLQELVLSGNDLEPESLPLTNIAHHAVCQ